MSIIKIEEEGVTKIKMVFSHLEKNDVDVILAACFNAGRSFGASNKDGEVYVRVDLVDVQGLAQTIYAAGGKQLAADMIDATAMAIEKDLPEEDAVSLCEKALGHREIEQPYAKFLADYLRDVFSEFKVGFDNCEHRHTKYLAHITAADGSKRVHPIEHDWLNGAEPEDFATNVVLGPLEVLDDIEEVSYVTRNKFGRMVILTFTDEADAEAFSDMLNRGTDLGIERKVSAQFEYEETECVEIGHEAWGEKENEIDDHDLRRAAMVALASSRDEEEHVETHGRECPKCGTEGVEGDGVATGNGTAEQEMSCPHCYTTWTDTYVLSGFTNRSEEVPQGDSTISIDDKI